MFRPVPPGRHLGTSLSFPFDSSCVSRRSKSEVSSLLEHFDSKSVDLRNVPIQFRWQSAHQPEREIPKESQKLVSERERIAAEGSSLQVDPHRTGFGKIPKSGAVRLPPVCRIREGILGVDPFHGTRVVHHKHEGNPRSSPYGGSSRTSSPPPSCLGFVDPLPSEAPSHFAAIGRFVGYFQLQQAEKVSPESYAQVVRDSLSPGVLRSEMNRREGFGSGRQGRGAGRTNARTNVWQRIDGRDQRGPR